MTLDLDKFKIVFEQNVQQRSRTAKGTSNTGVSTLKLPLLLEGEELKEKLQENVARTALMIGSYQLPKTGDRIRSLLYTFDTWFDSLQERMIDMQGYERKRRELNLPSPNPRYRIWEVKYDPSSSKVGSIHADMGRFARQLVEMMDSAPYYPQLLAFADYEMDKIIHPWLDGCGRFATALVMWIAAQFPTLPLPVFGERTAHYKAMNEGLASHTQYFAGCLHY